MASPGVGGSISAASDVLLDNPGNDQVLKRDGSYWKNLEVSKANVGLDNVDNTSDTNKPVSSAAQTALDAKLDKVGVRTDSDTSPLWRTDFTGTLETTDQDISEHRINGTRTAWTNEWGASRGTAPFADALFRAIRTDSDALGSGNAPAFHLNDRRTGAVSLHMWARTWAGGLLRNGVSMSDTYVTTYTDPTDDPNYANLPDGTHIVVVEV